MRVALKHFHFFMPAYCGNFRNVQSTRASEVLVLLEHRPCCTDWRPTPVKAGVNHRQNVAPLPIRTPAR